MYALDLNLADADMNRRFDHMQQHAPELVDVAAHVPDFRADLPAALPVLLVHAQAAVPIPQHLKVDLRRVHRRVQYRPVLRESRDVPQPMFVLTVFLTFGKLSANFKRPGIYYIEANFASKYSLESS